MKILHFQQQKRLSDIKYTKGKDQHWNYRAVVVKIVRLCESAMILNAGKQMNGRGHIAALAVVSAFSQKLS